MNRLYFSLLCLFACGTAQAAPIEIRNRFLGGEIVIEADDSRISAGDLKRYLVVHPKAYDHSYYISSNLQLCIKDEPAYKPCGSHDIHAKYFLDNAKHNLELDKQRLAYLHDLNKLPELQPLVDHFSSSLRFGIWINERLIEYFQTWNPSALEQNYDNLQIVQETKGVLQKLKVTTDIDSRWGLAMNDWHNAANSLYRKTEKDIPAEAWNKFIRKYHIRESVEFDEED